MDIFSFFFLKLSSSFFFYHYYFTDEENSETEQSMDVEVRHLDSNQSLLLFTGMNVGTLFNTLKV